MTPLTDQGLGVCDTRVATANPYRNGWEHLEDELKRLALRVLLRLHTKGHRRPKGPLEGFQGFVISEEEIAGILRDLAGPKLEGSSDAEIGTWMESLAGMEACIRMRLAASARERILLPLPHLCRLFRLSPFEEQCLVIALAPELDLRYEKLYAYLHDDMTRKQPSVGLMLDLLCETVEDALIARHAFDLQAPLLKYHFCRLGEASPAGSSLSPSLKLDERITEFLLGRRQLDPQLNGIARLVLPGADPSPVLVNEELRDRLSDFVEVCCCAESKTRGVVIHLLGPRGAGKRALVESVCRRAALPLVVADFEKLSNGTAPFEAAVYRLGREALLQAAALCVEGLDIVATDPDKNRSRLETMFEAFGLFSRLTFLTSRDAWKPPGLADERTFVAVNVPPPDQLASQQLWEAYLVRETDLVGDVDAGELASRFRLGTAGMHEALVAARDLARWRSPREAHVTMADVMAGCRSVTTPRLSALARKITPRQAWEDLVLPADQLTHLQELCNQARYRHVVLGEWGFERKLPLGKGLSALFSGPPGTGKTMAAQVIASELQLDLYQIDLSQVVSKYIGETEKNLRKVFDEADASQAILFFDEADALFGKRSEVKDAHDRYANIEIGYLLQRMEEYEGIAILATNLRQNLDEAFVRRLRFIVEFPFPDEEHRRRIWGVTLPREAPLAEDVDFAVLARELKLAGGYIKNVALAAAFGAAAEGSVIGMSHLLQAARREHQKLGRSWTDSR